jgi:hypothetical protein
MTSLSTRFFGHPRLMNPAFGMKGGPPQLGDETIILAWHAVCRFWRLSARAGAAEHAFESA